MSASPIGLVVILFDTALESLQRAAAAIRTCDVETRVNELNHALAVVAELHRSLNIDNGGEFAARMNRYYDSVRIRIMDANMSVSEGSVDKIASELRILRDAWSLVDVRRSEKPADPVVSPSQEADGCPSSWTA